ncbi:MAG: type II secretion system protein [Lachnospirales bacterium]
MRKKGVTLIEIIASVCIIGVLFVGIGVFMVNSNKFVDVVKLTEYSYNSIDVDLAYAQENDNTINGIVDNQDEDSDVLSATVDSVEVFGQEIPYELFYTEEQTIMGRKVKDFTYNFEENAEIGDSPVTDVEVDKSIFPLDDDYMLDNEPLNSTNDDGEEVLGLLGRTNSNHVPRIDYTHIKYLEENTNFVTIKESDEYIYRTYSNVAYDVKEDKWNYVTQKLIDDGLEELQRKISDDSSNRDKYQVLYFERDYAYRPVLFPTENTIDSGGNNVSPIEIDLTKLSSADEEVNFIFITNGIIGSHVDYHYSLLNSNTDIPSKINITGGNVYFISMKQSIGVDTNFYINEDIDYKPQFTYATAMPRRTDSKATSANKINHTMIIGGNASFFIYSPSTLINLSASDKAGADKFTGAFVLKKGSYINPNVGELEREEWKGTADILGYY